MESTENQKLYNVEIDSLSIPIYIFDGETPSLEDKLTYVSDDRGVITLVTPEDEAKEILYKIATPSEEYQLIMNKMIDEDIQEQRNIIEISGSEKDYLKDSKYNLSLVFLGENEETGNLKFRVVQDTITGDLSKTTELLSTSVFYTEE
jgi:hypothetical protein